MFERFTQEAREIVVAAHGEARALHHGWIGDEHLLVGVAATPRGADLLADLGLTPAGVREAVRRRSSPPGLDADALAAVGIDLDAVRDRVEARFGEGALDRPPGAGRRRGGPRRLGGGTPFTGRAKRVLEHALQEAVALGDRHIGAEHLLLAVAREDEGVAAAVLRPAGVGRAAVHAAIQARRRAA
jgi:ATP-dependent Clp protease ATP-binding subunit ClpA